MFSTHMESREKSEASQTIEMCVYVGENFYFLQSPLLL